MLTEDEKKAATKLFRYVPDEETMSLARTVTKDQLHLVDKSEALSAILAYTENAAELLRRKKLKREVLFRYLHGEGVTIAPTADKSTIMRKVLEHWGSADVEPDFSMEDDDGDILPLDMPLNTEQHFAAQPIINNQVGDSWCNNALCSTSEDQEMALQFSHWFYQLLNACNPIYITSDPTQERFGPHHFFRDANISLLMVDGHAGHAESASTSDAVCKILSSLTNERQLIFNPNLDASGVKGLSDPHGMRVIIVCGTVHQKLNVIGLFEQQFGLVRDPFSENKWKIKFTRVVLSSKHSSHSPTLDFTRRMLSS